MSEAVERRLITLLGSPRQCPHGNPIPGLDELGADLVADSRSEEIAGLTTMKAAVQAGTARVVVRRISEQLQPDAQIMRLLRDAGIQPGRVVEVEQVSNGVRVSADGHSLGVDDVVAAHIFVTTAGPEPGAAEPGQPRTAAAGTAPDATL